MTMFLNRLMAIIIALTLVASTTTLSTRKQVNKNLEMVLVKFYVTTRKDMSFPIMEKF
jgi:hypothetical protein